LQELFLNPLTRLTPHQANESYYEIASIDVSLSTLRGKNMKTLFVLIPMIVSASAQAGVFHNIIERRIEMKNIELHHRKARKLVDVQQDTFDQVLDHFDSSNSTTFKQRYFIALDDTHGNANAPVIYYQCGEGNCLDGYPIEPAIATYAASLGAAIVILEHRYYGRSQPFDQMTGENLKYLTYEQALEDFAVFQKYITQKMGFTGKWIFAGGSYSGALSAYYRLKYPELVVGALSSSGVVKTETSFEDYDHLVAIGLGSDCLAAVKDVTHRVESVLNDPAALAKIQTTFQSQDIKDPLDFLSVLDGMASAAVQYGQQDAFCKSILSSTDHLSGFATGGLAALQILGLKPVDMTFQGAESTATSDYEAGVGVRQWAYQSCVEFGGFAVPYHDPSMSAESSLLDLQYNLNGCKKLFGLTTPPDTDRMYKTYYLPLLDPSTSNIFFTNGSIDPYSMLSIATADGNVTNPNTAAFTLTGLAHCGDLGGSDGSGGVVDQAQAMFLKLANQWLK
jgi:pimeloyl-ACP methyl ester carboxylesterase